MQTDWWFGNDKLSGSYTMIYLFDKDRQPIDRSHASVTFTYVLFWWNLFSHILKYLLDIVEERNDWQGLGWRWNKSVILLTYSS